MSTRRKGLFRFGAGRSEPVDYRAQRGLGTGKQQAGARGAVRSDFGRAVPTWNALPEVASRQVAPSMYEGTTGRSARRCPGDAHAETACGFAFAQERAHLGFKGKTTRRGGRRAIASPRAPGLKRTLICGYYASDSGGPRGFLTLAGLSTLDEDQACAALTPLQDRAGEPKKFYSSARIAAPEAARTFCPLIGRMSSGESFLTELTCVLTSYTSMSSEG